jgi:hypothetical protein
MAIRCRNVSPLRTAKDHWVAGGSCATKGSDTPPPDQRRAARSDSPALAVQVRPAAPDRAGESLAAKPARQPPISQSLVDWLTGPVHPQELDLEIFELEELQSG